MTNLKIQTYSEALEVIEFTGLLEKRRQLSHSYNQSSSEELKNEIISVDAEIVRQKNLVLSGALRGVIIS